MSTLNADRTPLATAKTFLSGIKARNTDLMAHVAHDDATACVIREGKPVHTTIKNILERIDTVDGKVEMDEVSYDEIEHEDGDFATVWTPYRFFEDGKLHHTGTNNFCLWKSPDKGWLITAVQDVARPAEGITGMRIIGGSDRDSTNSSS